jgi:hypothetical protein
MDKEREIMHKILDNDAGADEKKLVTESMESDPGMREEFSALANAVSLIEKSERVQAPAFFTAEVMRRLPKRRPTVLERLREFLFGSRVLQWNMASALAAALLFLVTAAIFRTDRGVAPIVATGPSEPMVTVRLTFHSPGARSVAVAGEFNKWKTNADLMNGKDGTWSIDLKLKPGAYTYSFIVDGKTWVPDPGAESYEDDGFGSRNAVLKVNI